MADEYWPGETQVFSRDECFLCGVVLDDSNRTDEHVFAKWLLRMFDTWDSTIELLNGTQIPYKSITIPCCASCNSGPLSQLEAQVASAVGDGLEGVRQLPPDTLFLWLSKLSYGLLHLEHFLALDRTTEASPAIVDREMLEEYRLHHYLMQSILGRVRWEEFPATILLFPTKTNAMNRRQNFDFNDGPFGPFISIRLGEVGIVAVLQDWGALGQQPLIALDRARRLDALAPLQFREVSAVVRYTAALFNRTVKHVITQAGGVAVVFCLPLGGFAGGYLYDEFDGDNYTELLAHVVGLDVETVRPSPGHFVTWLVDDSGEPLDLPFEAWPADLGSP